MIEEDFLSGNEAVAEGAIAAGCKFFAGYPITPSTEILEAMARLLPKVGGRFIQMEDELASIAAAIGASWTGKKSMTATSGPGFSLMQENIGYAIMTETPVVIVNVQRGGPSTGQPTVASQGDVMQARWGTHGDHSIIAMAPNSAQECYDLTIEAFNLSERFRTPVILLSDAEIGHMRERVIFRKNVKLKERVSFKDGIVTFPFDFDFDPEPHELVSPFPTFGHKNRVHVTGLTHNIVGYPQTSDSDVQENLLKRVIDKIELNRSYICRTDIFNPGGDILIVSYGSPSRAAIEVAENNRDISLLRLITLWPFPEDDLMMLAKNVDAILVLEMNDGQILREVERFARRAGCKRIEFLPKVGGKVHYPEEIESKVMEMRGT